MEDLKQLEEPQKPVVPQFVADWYEENKDSFDYNLWEYLTDWEKQEPSGFKNWISNKNNAIQTLVNMHQFGYEVEKERRYRVKLKGMVEDFVVLKLDKIRDGWYLGMTLNIATRKSNTPAKSLKMLASAGYLIAPALRLRRWKNEKSDIFSGSLW